MMEFDKILENIPLDEAEKIKLDIANVANKGMGKFKFQGRIYI